MVRVDPSRHYGGPALSEESVVPITADKDVLDHIPKNLMWNLIRCCRVVSQWRHVANEMWNNIIKIKIMKKLKILTSCSGKEADILEIKKFFGLIIFMIIIYKTDNQTH